MDDGAVKQQQMANDAVWQEFTVAQMHWHHVLDRAYNISRGVDIANPAGRTSQAKAVINDKPSSVSADKLIICISDDDPSPQRMITDQPTSPKCSTTTAPKSPVQQPKTRGARMSTAPPMLPRRHSPQPSTSAIVTTQQQQVAIAAAEKVSTANQKAKSTEPWNYNVIPKKPHLMEKLPIQWVDGRTKVTATQWDFINMVEIAYDTPHQIWKELVIATGVDHPEGDVGYPPDCQRKASSDARDGVTRCPRRPDLCH